MKLKVEISAGGIVYKQENNQTIWLVIQHSTGKHWTFPKGLIGDKKISESMEDAALREVEEEGGIKAKIIHSQPTRIQYTYKWNDTLVKKTVYYFLMEYVSGDPKNHDWEVSQAKFLPENEVKKILTYKSDKEAFAKILKLLK